MNRRAAILLAAVGVGGGCAAPAPPPPAPSLTLAQLDTLHALPAWVAVRGVVLEQSADGMELVVEDETGLVRVRLPEAAPDLDLRAIQVVGWVQQGGDGLEVVAEEWLFVQPWP